ncbi:MAG: hypothetical protein Q7T95_06015, partial [Hydrogenophaga sp.]|nr:hypothetical protein [Hydrogenophaga sp.]
MSDSISQDDFLKYVRESTSEPWAYIGAVAGMSQAFSQNTVRVFEDIAMLANEMRSGLMSDAKRFEKSEVLWRELSAGLRADMEGMKGRLNSTAQVWANKAIEALQSKHVLDDIQSVKTPAKLLTLVGELSKMLGGMALAAQLIAEAYKDTSPTGPSVADMTKLALGLAAGVMTSVLLGTSLPAIGLGLLAGFAVDIAWNTFSKDGLSTEFKTASFWDVFFDFFTGNNVSGISNTAFNAARDFVQQRDPLVLDLDGDGDGLELAPASSNLLFDHNADGIKAGTGWARADDGFLVRDLNSNGLIDSGRELFGVDTVKRNGQFATQGFDALSDLDTNADGQITSADAAWSELQVWRDLNQDGITQAGELNSLSVLNITNINLNGNAAGPQAGQTVNNNRVALSTTFTQGGETRTVGAIDLESNPFFSHIPAEQVHETGSPVTLPEAAAALPQMNGSGMVRNLRAAMSQAGAAADELEAAVVAF